MDQPLKMNVVFVQVVLQVTLPIVTWTVIATVPKELQTGMAMPVVLHLSIPVGTVLKEAQV